MKNSSLSQPKSKANKTFKQFQRLLIWWKIYVVEGLLLKRKISDFYRIFGGHILFQTVYAGVEFDLFSILKKHNRLSLQEISKALSLEEQPCRIMLLGLVAGKILKKKGDFYSNSIVADRLFTSTSPYKVIDYVKLQHHVMYPALRHFTESVKEYKNVGLKEFVGDEPTIYQRLAHKPEIEKIFQSSMQELSLQSNSFLAKCLDLSSSKFLVDVGGGDGTNCIAFVKNNPHLKAAVFDSPTVCLIAEENIKTKGYSNQVSAVVGNAFEGNYPVGVDTIMFCHFFTIWSKEENLLLLQKAYSSLENGGKCLIFNMMQHDDGTGPLSAAIGSPYFLACATGKGMLYAWKEYEDLFLKAGFQNIERQRLPRDHGLIIGTKVL